MLASLLRRPWLLGVALVAVVALLVGGAVAVFGRGGDSTAAGAAPTSAAPAIREVSTAGIEPDARVALWVPKGIRTYVAVHGALAAGCAYVPIDTSAPPTRVAWILQESWLHSRQVGRVRRHEADPAARALFEQVQRHR